MPRSTKQIDPRKIGEENARRLVSGQIYKDINAVVDKTILDAINSGRTKKIEKLTKNIFISSNIISYLNNIDFNKLMENIYNEIRGYAEYDKLEIIKHYFRSYDENNPLPFVGKKLLQTYLKHSNHPDFVRKNTDLLDPKGGFNLGERAKRLLAILMETPQAKEDAKRIAEYEKVQAQKRQEEESGYQRYKEDKQATLYAAMKHTFNVKKQVTERYLQASAELVNTLDSSRGNNPKEQIIESASFLHEPESNTSPNISATTAKVSRFTKLPQLPKVFSAIKESFKNKKIGKKTTDKEGLEHNIDAAQEAHDNTISDLKELTELTQENLHNNMKFTEDNKKLQKLSQDLESPSSKSLTPEYIINKTSEVVNIGLKINNSQEFKKSPNSFYETFKYYADKLLGSLTKLLEAMSDLKNSILQSMSLGGKKNVLFTDKSKEEDNQLKAVTELKNSLSRHKPE